MKKFIVFLILLFLPISLVLAIESPFFDVSATHENYTAIKWLFDQDMIDGYPDGSYKPANSVNRAEAAKIITGAAKIDPLPTDISPFPDVDPGEWFASYVNAAMQAGIIEGKGDGSYDPGGDLLVVETLAIVLRAYPEAMAEINSDPDKTPWYAPYVKFAVEKNIIDALFSQGSLINSASRAFVSETMYRMAQIAENNFEPFVSTSSPVNPDDPYEGTWKGIAAPDEIACDGSSIIFTIADGKMTGNGNTSLAGLSVSADGDIDDNGNFSGDFSILGFPSGSFSGTISGNSGDGTWNDIEGGCGGSFSMNRS